jgi:hypothetical protein
MIEDKNMQRDDSKFESYLREFEPRRPQPLEQPVLARTVWPRRLAAAAAIAIGLGTLQWADRKGREQDTARSSQGTPFQPSVKTGASQLLLLPMTRLALEDPERFDTELVKASRTTLPNFRQSDGILRVLAEE